MRVAIVHYHLRGGGVTRVIRNAATLLRERGVNVCVLCGERPPEPPAHLHFQATTVAGLGYLDDAGGFEDGAALANRLNDAATTTLKGKPDLWHFHNPTLGKNPLLSRAIFDLALRGETIILHIHDFAEDGRPENYRRLQPLLNANPALVYPLGGRVHYATSNERDQQVLLRAGAAHVEILPHPAAILDQDDTPPAEKSSHIKEHPHEEKPLVFAPVRGIRRKNIGELGLLALLETDPVEYVTSLAVRSGESAPIHRRWETFFAAQTIPVRLGGAEREGCAALAVRARNFVTTSVLEGFGLSILEAALFGKPLAGRDLPDVTSLARKAGLIPRGMYSRLWIPPEWVGANAWQQQMATCLRRTWAAYRRQARERDVATAIRACAREDGAIDFGALDEPFQERVLECLAQDRECAAVVRELNPELRLEGGWTEAAGLEEFSPDKCGDRLLSFYKRLLAEESVELLTKGALDHERILDAFLAPERFRLLLSV